MPRRKRIILPRELGVMHIYSRVAGGGLILGTDEKEQLLKMIERFSSAFFVTLHEFTVMSNHFHLVLSEGRHEAAAAEKEKLLERYHRVYGEDADPPVGRQLPDGRFIPDPDGGVERLRKRLGSVSAFVQELKQRFTLWYNKKNHRKGYLWGARFGTTLIEKGDAAMIIGGYLNLNPVRAKMVELPDKYLWCGLGLHSQNPERARSLMMPMPVPSDQERLDLPAYRLFVYRYGDRPVPGHWRISPDQLARVEALCRRIGLLDMAAHRIRNFSEGFALGSPEFIARVQNVGKKREVKARRVREGVELFCTRLLR